MISVILAYLKKDALFEALLNAYDNPSHLVIQYFKILALDNPSMTEDFFKMFVLKQSLMKYDYLTVHFLHKEASQFFYQLNYYKDAARTYKQLYMYTNLMQKSLSKDDLDDDT